jgi:bifunctional non-homologous end joining protein LigD
MADLNYRGRHITGTSPVWRHWGVMASPRHALAGLRRTESFRRSGPLQPSGFIEPCHPVDVGAPPAGGEWLHEIKSDGYRAQLHLRDTGAVVYSRRGHDWTEQFAAIARAAARLSIRHAVLDGEAVVQNSAGVADFHALRRELGKTDSNRLVFYAFDLLYLNGKDLRGQPLLSRKRQLKKLLAGAPDALRYVDHLEGSGADIFEHACALGAEGIVSKKRDAAYRSGRQGDWIKSKCRKSGTYPIIAFVEKLGARPRRIASFYIGRRDGKRLLYAGKVRGGFKESEAREIREKLDPLVRKTSPLSEPIKKPKATWVEPVVEAEVQYGSVTEDGVLRESVFKMLRDDLASAPPPRHKRAPLSAYRGGVPRANILQLLPDAAVPSKEELAAYWRRIAKRALPYLANRPLKFVRHTRGTTFYHMGPLPPAPATVHQLRIRKREGGEGVRLWVDDLAGLLGLVEIGVVEVHPWAATIDDYEHADMLIFDLDPGPGLAWDVVIETALAMRGLLQSEGFDSWPKVTGGKGLHVMAPLERKLTHDKAHAYAKRLALRLAATAPDLLITTADPRKRDGRLFIDYLRNGRGTTAVGAYSPRARPGFPIAAPVSWRQVENGIFPDALTLGHPLRASRA